MTITFILVLDWGDLSVRPRSNSFELRCSRRGERGPLLYLLHGFGGGPLDWHHLAPLLEVGHRLVIPNLTPLFSAEQPLGFSQQVELLAQFINQQNLAREPFVLLGSSFGATLSWGLRAHFQSLVSAQVMINPMPLDPLAHLKSPSLRTLFGLNMVPGALSLFLNTQMGRKLLNEMGHIFGFGLSGRRGLMSLSERKTNLVSKAVQRFAWIAQHENWEYWREQLRDHLVPLLLITGTSDPLFSEKDFRSYQLLVPLSEHQSIPDADHVMVRHHAESLSRRIIQFVASLSTEPTLDLGTVRRAI